MSKTNLLLTTKKTIAYIKKRVKNFPNSEIVLKENIERNMNELIELIFYFVNNDKIIIKNKYIREVIKKIQIIAFHIDIAYEKDLITDQRYKDIIRYLSDIKKIAYIILKHNIEVIKGDGMDAI